MERISGKCVKKNVFTVRIVFWVAAMTRVQCFVLCLREEGPKAVTGLYFGWPAFRNRHFVIWGRGAGWGGDPPQLYSSLVTPPPSPPLTGYMDGWVGEPKPQGAQFDLPSITSGGVGEQCTPQGPVSSEVTKGQRAHRQLRSLECSVCSATCDPGARGAYTQARRYLPLTSALVRFGDRQQSARL